MKVPAVHKSVVPIEIIRRTAGDPVEPSSHAERAEGVGILVKWSDGTSSFLDSKTLRSNCPCATCLEARGDRTHAKPLGGASRLRVVSSEIDQELDLQEVFPVGRYAVGIRWGDEHSSGIYTFEQLRQLAEAPGTTGQNPAAGA